MIRRSRIQRNPEPASEALPIHLMGSSFYPYFIARHLTQESLEQLTESTVAGDLWDSTDANARVFCLPGQPLSLKLRRFVPKRDLIPLQRDSESNTVQIPEFLPVGIYGADPIKLALNLNDYLNKVVNNHLLEQTLLILPVNETHQSNWVLNILFEWFQSWKETVS